MKYLTAAEILGTSDLATEDVDVPEWGGTVRVRELSARARHWFVANAFIDQPKLNGTEPPRRLSDTAQAMLLAKSIVDGDGNLVFTEDQIAALAEKSHLVTARIEAVATRLSRLRAEDVEDAEKNSVAAPSGDSSSA